MNDTIQSRLHHINNLIHAAVEQSARSCGSVQLIVVTKTRSCAEIEEAIAEGQTAFAENYVLEAIPKMLALKQYPLEWHFVGAIQANKTRMIAEHFDWVHSVSRKNIAQRLHDQRPMHLPPLNICIQVNVDSDPAKTGVALDEILPLAEHILTLPRLRLRGLMTLPSRLSSEQNPATSFQTLRQAQQRLQKHIDFALDTLSMGMSQDFEIAIAEGATLVRIGHAIFASVNN